MKILISGASGLVATELIFLLLNRTDYRLVLLTRNCNMLRERYRAYLDRVDCYVLDNIITKNPKPDFDVVIHTAFARSSSGKDIAESLEYQYRLCRWLKNGIVKKFLNISSQSIYGNDYEPGVDESGVPAPDYLYALGKYSSELIVTTIFSDSNTKFFNIRLSSVCENARFMRIFVEKALNGSEICLSAPNQIVSFIDVRDVAYALYLVIISNKKQAGTYNLGTGKWYSILDVVNCIEEVGIARYGIKSLKLNIRDNGNNSHIGMSSSLFENTFKWHPKYDLRAMIISLYEMLINVNKGGGYPLAFKIVYNL